MKCDLRNVKWEMFMYNFRSVECEMWTVKFRVKREFNFSKNGLQDWRELSHPSCLNSRATLVRVHATYLKLSNKPFALNNFKFNADQFPHSISSSSPHSIWIWNAPFFLSPPQFLVDAVQLCSLSLWRAELHSRGMALQWGMICFAFWECFAA